MKKIKGILTVLCLLTVGIPVAGGGVGSTFTNDGVCTQIDDVASWTYMAYWIGDMKGNDPSLGMIDLDDDLLDTINMMEFSGSTSEVNIVIQADDYKMWGGNKDTFGGTRRYLIQQDDNIEELADYTLEENVWYFEEQNMGNPNTLMDFILWATSNFPAEHYILAIRGHGEGWVQICQDLSSGLIPHVNYFNKDTSISIVPELRSVLSACPHVDILFFSSCHMGQIEVFYEMKDFADIIIATESFAGGPSDNIKIPIINLTNNPDMNSIEVAQSFVDSYNVGEFYGCDFFSPMFAIQTKYMDDIVGEVNKLTESLVEEYNSHPIKTRKLISRALEHSRMNTTPKDGLYETLAHELYEFAEELCNLTQNNIPSINNPASNLISVIDNSSIIKHSEKTYENYHGFGIFSPPRTKKNLKNYYTFCIWLEIFGRNSYKNLKFSEDTQWDKILDIMYPLRRVILKFFNLN